MMKWFMSSLLMVLGISYSAHAQQAGYKNFLTVLDTSKTITVTGESKIDILPDFYSLEISFSDRFCKKGESIESLFENLKDIVKSLKIPLDSLEHKNTKRERGYFGSMGGEDFTETRYYAIRIYQTKTFRMFTSKLSEYPSLTFSLEDTGNSKMEDYKTQLYEQAVKDARKKAETMAKVSSQQVTSTLSVNEISFSDDASGTTNDEYDIYYRLRLKIKAVFKAE